jgi:hypothetical protein
MWKREAIMLLPPDGQVTPFRTGDDGTFKAGRPGGHRYADLGNGTILDRFTSLVWARRPERIIPGVSGVVASNEAQAACGNWATGTVYAAADVVAQGGLFYVCAVAHTSGTFATDLAASPPKWRQTLWTASAANLTTPATMTWANAVDNCLALVFAGFDDWRLPNAFELISLYDLSRTAPSANVTAFPTMQTSQSYWTSTIYSANTGYAHYVSFAGGVNSAVAGVGSSYNVRPVRGGRVNG